MWFLCIRCLRARKQACITLWICRLPGFARKDESRLVISIDFKADLIDLFKGNKKAKERAGKAVNLIREFPGNIGKSKLLIILETLW